MNVFLKESKLYSKGKHSLGREFHKVKVLGIKLFEQIVKKVLFSDLEVWKKNFEMILCDITLGQINMEITKNLAKSVLSLSMLSNQGY